MKTRWLDRRIAAPGPFLALVLSSDEFEAAVRHMKAKTEHGWLNAGADATTHVLTSDRGGSPCCIVALSGAEGRSGVEVAGMLVHEAVHVWQAYCEGIGEASPGREQEAYGIQAIAQELMAEYARRINEV